MHFIVYKNSDFSVVIKERIDEVKSLPGSYFVFYLDFQKIYSERSYKNVLNFINDNFIYENYKIGDFELVDLVLYFDNVYRPTLNATIFRYSDNSLKKVTKYASEKGLALGMSEICSFLVKIFNLLSTNNSWSILDSFLELENLKKENLDLKSELDKIKSEK